MALRREQLEDSVKLQQFLHDTEEELRWVRERESLASSTALGNSLTTVQALLKKHQVLHNSNPITYHVYFWKGDGCGLNSY